MKPIITALIALVLATSHLHAQTLPTIAVLGVGQLTFDVPLPPAEAQAQSYRAYIDSRPPIALTVSCTATADGALCVTPLAPLNLTGTHTLALTAVTSAADGEQEVRTPAPFTLRKVGLPVAPPPASFKVRPGL